MIVKCCIEIILLTQPADLLTVHTTLVRSINHVAMECTAMTNYTMYKFSCNGYVPLSVK